MLKHLYHTVSNKILLYKYDKRLWKLPLYHAFVTIDYIIYALSPLNFHLSRSEHCGTTYVVSNFGVFHNEFDDLQLYIQRTQSGMLRQCPLLVLPLADSYELPLSMPHVGFDRDPHRDIRPSVLQLETASSDIIQQEVSRFIQSSITQNRLTVSVKSIPLKRLVYKMFGFNTLDIPDDEFSNLDKPLSNLFTQIISKFIPQRFLITKKRSECMYKLADIISAKHPSFSDIERFNTISAIENGSNAMFILLHETIKQIVNNNLIDILREELQNDNTDLLQRCVFEATRFMTYHAGATLVETLVNPQTYTIDKQSITLQPRDTIIRSLNACLHDPKYFPKTFYPYQPNLELVKRTTFNGTLDENLDNRCCRTQQFTPIFMTELIKQLLLNYEWDSVNTKLPVSPFLSLIFKNIRPRH